MNLKKLILFSGMLMLCFSVYSQRSIWRGAYNRLGLKAGVNHFNIVTDDLPISGNTSWTAGFTTRSSFSEDFQFIYGINFFDLNAKVTGRDKIELERPRRDIHYNMIGIQGNFFASYKILDHFLSVEAGPVLQVNGRFEPRQDKELWYIGDSVLQAKDISKVSAFNLNLAIGLSGGFETVKLWAQYQYGVNNILNNLNNDNLQAIDSSTPELEGHTTMIAAGIVMFL